MANSRDEGRRPASVNTSPSAHLNGQGPRTAGDGAAAYYDTADALGFLVEAVEPPAQLPPTDFAA